MIEEDSVDVVCSSGSSDDPGRGGEGHGSGGHCQLECRRPGFANYLRVRASICSAGPSLVGYYLSRPPFWRAHDLQTRMEFEHYRAVEDRTSPGATRLFSALLIRYHGSAAQYMQSRSTISSVELVPPQAPATGIGASQLDAHGAPCSAPALARHASAAHLEAKARNSRFRP
jgi:hypothetical protein